MHTALLLWALSCACAKDPAVFIRRLCPTLASPSSPAAHTNAASLTCIMAWISSLAARCVSLSFMRCRASRMRSFRPRGVYGELPAFIGPMMFGQMPIYLKG